MTTTGRWLVMMAWLAFLASLSLPAVVFPDSTVIPGWKAAWLAVSEFPAVGKLPVDVLVLVTGLGNIPLALAPLALRVDHPRLHQVYAITCIVLFCLAGAFYLMESDFSTGYFVWIGAFLVMGLGFGALVIGKPQPIARRQSGG